MREALRHRRLVHELPTGAQDARDLAQRSGGAGPPAAHVIARSEIDHEIESAVVEGQRSHIAFDDRGRDAHPRGARAIATRSGSMSTPVRDVGRRRRLSTGSATPRPQPTSSTRPPVGIASAHSISGISSRSCSPFRVSTLPNARYASSSPSSRTRIVMSRFDAAPDSVARIWRIDGRDIMRPAG